LCENNEIYNRLEQSKEDDVTYSFLSCLNPIAVQHLGLVNAITGAYEWTINEIVLTLPES
jgi:hypothetical protein